MGLFSKAIEGIAGNAKAILGIDAASETEKNKRWSTCSECSHKKNWICEKCGCIIGQKIKIASESCPLGLWLEEKAVTENEKKAKQMG